MPGAGLGWPLLGDGLVVVPTLRDEPAARAVASRSTARPATRVWAYEEPDSQGVAVASAGDTVVCALGNGVVVAIDRATRGPSCGAPCSVGEPPRSVAVSISERTALAVDAATGIVAFTARVGARWFVAMLDLAHGRGSGRVRLQRASDR